MLEKYDKDGDGKLSEEERKAMVEAGDGPRRRGPRGEGGPEGGQRPDGPPPEGAPPAPKQHWEILPLGLEAVVLRWAAAFCWISLKRENGKPQISQMTLIKLRSHSSEERLRHNR